MLHHAIPIVAAELAKLPAEQLERIEDTCSITFEDHFSFQTAQSLAFADQRISQDDALTIYGALGEQGDSSNGGWASGTDLATKVLVLAKLKAILETAVV